MLNFSLIIVVTEFMGIIKVDAVIGEPEGECVPKGFVRFHPLVEGIAIARLQQPIVVRLHKTQIMYLALKIEQYIIES